MPPKNQSNIDKLHSFIEKLHVDILAKNLPILNNPQNVVTQLLSTYLRAHYVARRAHEFRHLFVLISYVRELQKFYKDNGVYLWGTDDIKFVAENGIQLQDEEIQQYFRRYAAFTEALQVGSCDGLAAIGFALAEKKNLQIDNKKISIEICTLRNWTHTFLRILLTDVNTLESHSVFYDPWYEICLSKSPQITFISEQDLAQHMQQMVISCPAFITPIYPFESSSMNFITTMEGETRLIAERVTVHAKDFSYAILCSTETEPPLSRAYHMPEEASLSEGHSCRLI